MLRRRSCAEPTALWPGAPLEPTGNPMLDGVGPGLLRAARRRARPDIDGEPRIVPLRVAADFGIASARTPTRAACR